jgi:hypothetical protein
MLRLMRRLFLKKREAERGRDQGLGIRDQFNPCGNGHRSLAQLNGRIHAAEFLLFKHGSEL